MKSEWRTKMSDKHRNNFALPYATLAIMGYYLRMCTAKLIYTMQLNVIITDYDLRCHNDIFLYFFFIFIRIYNKKTVPIKFSITYIENEFLKETVISGVSE